MTEEPPDQDATTAPEDDAGPTTGADDGPRTSDARGPGVGVPPSAWPTGRLLSTAARQVERAWDVYLEQWSLSHSSLPVLAVLLGRAHTQRELADELHVTEQTISRMLAGLERTGYVRRRADPADRRRRTVAVTASGRAAVQALNDPAALEQLVTDRLSSQEVRALRTLLITMVTGSDPPG